MMLVQPRLIVMPIHIVLAETSDHYIGPDMNAPLHHFFLNISTPHPLNCLKGAHKLRGRGYDKGVC